MSAFKSGFIQGMSTQFTDPMLSISDHFDFALLSPSWDRRSLCITGSSMTVDYAVLFDFVARDSQGLQVKHLQEVSGFAASHAGFVEKVVIDALRLRESWQELWNRVVGYARSKGRPIRMFVDLTTCPRFYSLGLIAGCLKAGVASNVTAFYAEGKYLHPNATTTTDYPFTFGHWKAVPIPFLQGVPRAGRQRHYIVSVGFEGVKTARILTKADPDRVSLLFPTPGVQRGYATQTEQKNRRIIEEYNIPRSDVLKVHAADAIKAWAVLSKSGLSVSQNEEVSYLCCGTKPHALACALDGLSRDTPAVLYNLPELHTFVDVHARGRYWRYDISDLTSIAPV